MQITLKAARINAGYSQKQAAEELKVPATTLNRWEKGTNKIPAKPFLELCRIYKVDTGSIILP